MTIQEILALPPSKLVEVLRVKDKIVPTWDILKKEYDPKNHPVMNQGLYPDIVLDGGGLDKVTRLLIPDQQLYAKRMTGLCVGTPVYRNYQTEDNAKLKEIADVIEAVLTRNRINTLNVERLKKLFSCCEIATVWYGQDSPTMYAGKLSPNKIRCRTYSPMDGAILYPLFDQYDDMKAFSVYYKRIVDHKDVEYFDVYTAEEIRNYFNNGSDWVLNTETSKRHTLGKISVSYCMRPTPIWEDTSNITYEKEWILSRSSNYVRHNSAPNKVLTTDENQIETMNERLGIGKNKSSALSKDFVLPLGSQMQIVEWQGATDAAKFVIEQASKQQDKVLQLPDLSFEAISNVSTETLKMALQDAQMKVTEESGRLLEFFDREINVIKEHIKPMFSSSDWKLVDGLVVNSEIIPYQVNDELLEANKLAIQTGNLAFVSRNEAVRQVFGAERAEIIIKELEEQDMKTYTEPTV